MNFTPEQLTPLIVALAGLIFSMSYAIRSAAVVMSTLAANNNNAFNDMRQTTLTLNRRVARLQTTVDKQGVQISERNVEIVGLKETIEKLRDQLTKYMEKTIQKDNVEAPPEDKKLLEAIKADSATAAEEKTKTEASPQLAGAALSNASISEVQP